MPKQLELAELIDLVTNQVLKEDLNTPIILIDGRAGAGKSTLAKDIQNRLFQQGDSLPRIIHLDDLYLGWEGLADGVDYLRRTILEPLLAKGTASWQEYDWKLNKRNSWREFSGGTPLIIEGCGAINTYTANLTNLSIWLESDEQTRKSRWIQRDGEKFLTFWDTWSAQELDFLSKEHSKDLASYFSVT